VDADDLVLDLGRPGVLLLVALALLGRFLVVFVLLGRARPLGGGPGGEVAADADGGGGQQGQGKAEGPPRRGGRESGAHGSILEGLRGEVTLPERLIIPRARIKNQGNRAGAGGHGSKRGLIRS